MKIKLSKYWEDAIHSLKKVKNIIDIRNLGLFYFELEPMDGKTNKKTITAYNF